MIVKYEIETQIKLLESQTDKINGSRLEKVNNLLNVLKMSLREIDELHEKISDEEKLSSYFDTLHLKWKHKCFEMTKENSKLKQEIDNLKSNI